MLRIMSAGHSSRGDAASRVAEEGQRGNFPFLLTLYPHSSTLAWKIPRTEEPGGLQSMGSQRSDTIERLHFHFSLSCTGEGNGNPLQCSCLENLRVGEACWAAIYGVARSWTRLKRLSSSSRLYDLDEVFFPFFFFFLGEVFLTNQCYVGYSPGGHEESDTTERLNSRNHPVPLSV